MLRLLAPLPSCIASRSGGPSRRLAHAIPTRGITTTTTTGSGPNNHKLWEADLVLARSGDTRALCDVGFAYQQGRVPGGEVSLSQAEDFYVQAADKGYSPACMLLGDLRNYHSNAADEAAQWYGKVVELTSAEEEGDGYIRAKALQKMGILNFVPNRSLALEQFQTALGLCQQHLKGNYPFLLAHDPPGLFELLQQEQAILASPEPLLGLLSQLSPGRQAHDARALVEYTQKVRAWESGEVSWALAQQEESLDVYCPGGSEACIYGLTYLQSFLRVMSHPAVKSCLASAQAGAVAGKAPAMLVLGSAIGNIAGWAVAGLGMRAVGLELLHSSVRAATALAAPLQEQADLHSLEFLQADALAEEALLATHAQEASVVWANDFAWATKDQRRLETALLREMEPGALLVLYRPPVLEGWKAIGQGSVSTSWDPALVMHIVTPEAEGR